jgi:hypothetical protein
MTEAQAMFEFLLDKFSKLDGVAPGKMMTAPAIKSKGKVFAFFYEEEMTFKLGKDFEPDAFGLENWSYLSPFKNKPPMTAWFAVPFSQKEVWEELTQMALSKI